MIFLHRNELLGIVLVVFQVKLCELYDEFEESSFDDEDFLDFRDKCNDLLKDIVYIVGKQIIDLLNYSCYYIRVWIFRKKDRVFLFSGEDDWPMIRPINIE